MQNGVPFGKRLFTRTVSCKLNKMNLAETIRRDIDVTGRITANATYFLSNLTYLDKPENIEDLKVIQSFPFLNIALSNLWSLSILELHKLLSISRNDKFRFTCVLNRLIENYNQIVWKKDISLEELEALIITIEEKQDIIKKLKSIRDKRIAHEDFVRFKFKFDISNMTPLLGLCQTIHNKLNLALYFSSTQWDYSEGEMVIPLSTKLKRYNRLNEEIRSNLVDVNPCIETDRLMKILRASS